MNHKFRAILALLLVLSISLVTVACNNNGDSPDETTEENTTIQENDTDESTSDSNQDTTGEDNTETEPVVNTTLDTSSSTDTTNSLQTSITSTTDSINSEKPSTIAEIVSYYNAASTKVKTSAKMATRVYNNTTNYKEILEIGSSDALVGIAKNLMESNMEEDLSRVEYSTRQEIIDNFPVRTITQSNLKESSVAKATCEDIGSYYKIYILLNCTENNPDVNPPLGGGKAGSLMNIVETSAITDAAGFIINFVDLENHYVDASVTCKIDKETGNMTYLETYLPSTMNFGEVSLKPLGFPKFNDISLGLCYEEKWEISW